MTFMPCSCSHMFPNQLIQDDDGHRLGCRKYKKCKFCTDNFYCNTCATTFNMKVPDLTLTRIDMHPPTPEDFEQFGERRKTDPIGQIVTGEFDNVNTPELIPIDIVEPEDFDSTFAQQFAMGAGLGICGFVVAYMILCALFGMK